MLVIYDTFTGNTERFSKKLGVPCLPIEDVMIADVDYVLITRTFGTGEVPESTLNFLYRNNNYKLMKAVAVSGNSNWANLYGAAGYKISDQFNVPLIHVFESHGFNKDVEKVKKEIEQLERK